VSFNGQQDLGENLTFHGTYHALALGADVPGPNVMVNATADGKGAGVGPHQRWSTGGLLDNFFVTGTQIQVVNAGNSGTGHGWEGANYVLWNCGSVASPNQEIDVYSPPNSQNWVIGGDATTTKGDGVFDQYGSTVTNPQSLYLKQLWDRMHPNPTVATAAGATPNPLGGSTSINLSVLGADASVGESNLTYTWTTVSKPSGATVTFGANATNAAKNTTASLSVSGTYILRVTIADAMGLLVTSTVVITPTAPITVNGDQDSVNENDSIRIVRNGTFVDVYRNNTVTPVLHQDYASSPELVINGLGGSDTITVDYSGGNPIPAAGLVVTAGSGTNDVLSVTGSSSNDAVTLGAGGTVTVNGGQFTYADFEEMDLNFGAGTDTITASGNGSATTNTVVLNVNGGGSVAMATGSTLPDFTDLNVSSGSTFNLNGVSETIDSLNGSGTVLDGSATAATLTVGSHNGGGTFSGVITNGTGTLSLVKNGFGSEALSGNNGYTGTTTINAGEIASGNSASLAGLSGAVMFNGGTFHVTANTVSANVANKYTTSYTGATSSSTATFSIDAGVTLTVGTVGGSASMRTNGGGAHGGDFFKTGAGTLDILSNNGQQDNPFELMNGTIIVESASGLGGGDAGVQLDMFGNNTTLAIRQDASTNFLTPVNIAEPSIAVNIVVDRQSGGPAVTHSINAITSLTTLTPVNTFTLNVSAGPNVTSGVAGLTVGSMTIGGTATINVGTNAQVTLTGALTGAFPLAKTGAGTLALGGTNTYTTTTISAGTLQMGIGGAGGTLGSDVVTDNAALVLNRSDTFTVANVISGSGTLQQAGSGTIILTGTNTYTGVTTINAGATLQIDSGSTTGTLGSAGVTDNGVLIFDRADNVTIGNTISGNGALQQIGPDTVTLTANNTYTGTTTVASGSTLQIGNLTTTGSFGTGTVTDNGALIFKRNTAITVANNISGSGSLQQSGAGLLTLNGSNTYTSPTTADATTTLTVNGSLASSGMVNANGTVNFAGNPGSGAFTRTLAAVSIGGGATPGLVHLLDSAFAFTPMTLNVPSLSFGAGAKMNIGNNEVITSIPLSMVRGQIVGGQFLTTTSGAGGAIGSLDLGGGTTEVRYTLLGDTNLDGIVNVADLANLAANFGATTGAVWIGGDLDYNNTVNVADLADLAANFGSSLPGSGSGAVAMSAIPAAAPAIVQPVLSPNVFDDTGDVERHRLFRTHRFRIYGW
jgi:autotransporter-associated beta strand protein